MPNVSTPLRLGGQSDPARPTTPKELSPAAPPPIVPMPRLDFENDVHLIQRNSKKVTVESKQVPPPIRA